MSERESRASLKIEATIARVSQWLADYFDRGPVRRFLYSLGVNMYRHSDTRIASAMAFNIFLAAIPTLALAGWLGGHLLGSYPEVLAAMSAYLSLTPLELHDLVRKNFQLFSVGAVAPLAILGAMWMGSSAFYMLMSVFEVAIRVRQRPWWKKRLIAIGCVLGANVLFFTTAWVTVKIAGGPAMLLRALRTGEQFIDPVEQAVSMAIAFVAATAALAGFFRVAVHRPGLNRRVWPGALVTVTIGGVASALFGIYARTLASYAVYYGSLAVVAVALAWIWIWCAALLFGAELNAQLEGGERIAPPSTVRLKARQRVGLRAQQPKPVHE